MFASRATIQRLSVVADRQGWLYLRRLPQEVKVPIRHYYIKASPFASKQTSKAELLEESTAYYNEAKVQLLAPNLHKQIFGEDYKITPDGEKGDGAEAERIRISHQHLKEQKILDATTNPVHNVSFPLPPLQGSDIERHFYQLGYHYIAPYLASANELAKAILPARPKQWIEQRGWTQYNADGTYTTVAYPGDRMLTFDVEVLATAGRYPSMAVAVSPTHWYSWTSPYITGESDKPDHLIPLGPSREERVVLGHNVGFDRSNVLEEYNLEQSSTRFLDTMSLHIAVAGLCSQQRPTWMSDHKKRSNAEGLPLGVDTSNVMVNMSETGAGTGALTGSGSETGAAEATSFYDVSSMNSLKDLAQFYCNIQLDKSRRDVFMKGSLDDVRFDFQNLMSYCADDVATTHAIYTKVWPRFLENCPHPISLAGVLEMGNSFLTVDSGWKDYLDRATKKHKELEDRVDDALQELALRAAKKHPTESTQTAAADSGEWRTDTDLADIAEDPWLSQLEWDVSSKRTRCPGAPKWYKDIYDKSTGKVKVSIRSRITPLLLRLKWMDYPLHYIKEFGWCYKVRNDNLSYFRSEKVSRTKPVLIDEDYTYFRLPHKDGEKANCGNPIAKGYIHHFEEGTLSSDVAIARDALQMNATSAYWISARERIMGQFVVWEGENSAVKDMGVKSVLKRKTKKAAATETEDNNRYGMILPQIITMGTITRRAVERTWLTASNAKSSRIGSELKAMIKAPPGYKIVGADVDSEELWISSLMGDAQFGAHGASALGWMTLQGTKSEGTDLHSKTAAILGVSRDKAKIFNYARIYGAGVAFAARLLQQFNPDITAEEAKERAKDLYSQTKGVKEHRRKAPFWHGGSETYMFNALEQVALKEVPRTPVLNCAITDALRPEYTKDQYLPSRINWVVQSSGVDYLHLLLVSMSHLIRKYDIKARFMLSVHDEVRYLAKEEDQLRCAMALQLANLWTRSLFSYRLGIRNLPQSVGFFSAVDVDHVLRKEADMDCVTPSNETVIEHGKSYSIMQLLNELPTVPKKSRKTNYHPFFGDEKSSESDFPHPPQDISDQYERLIETHPPFSPADSEYLEMQMYRDLAEWRKQKATTATTGASSRRKIVSKAELDELDLPLHLQPKRTARRRQAKPAEDIEAHSTQEIIDAASVEDYDVKPVLHVPAPALTSSSRSEPFFPSGTIGSSRNRDRGSSFEQQESRKRGFQPQPHKIVN